MWLHSGILTLSAAVLATAQVPSLGDCPAISPMQDFNISMYMGRWYEAERYFSIYQMGGVCVTLDYINDDDNSIKSVSRLKSVVTGTMSEIEGEVGISRGETQGKMVMTYPYLPMKIPYSVLSTDYDNYSVTWSCLSLGFVSTRNAWILTRERHPPMETMLTAYSVLDKFGISKAFLIRTNEWSCPDDVEITNSTLNN